VKKKLIYLFLALVFLASSWSLLHPKFFRVHDYTHAARIVEMSQALRDGHFPVRWTKNFGFGYGMPLFEFYAPLPFYLGSFFYLLGLDVVICIKLLFLICNFLTLLGAYKLGVKLFNKKAGVLMAAALTMAPYRAMNLFIRGALSEAWGMMALPWILFGLVKVINKEKRGWLTFVLGLVMLMLSHNITTMIFLPFVVLFAVLYIVSLVIKQDHNYLKKGQGELRSKRRYPRVKIRFKEIFRTLFQVVLNIIFAASLSAFYLFPAFLEKSFTKVEETILGGYFNYQLHSLYIRQFFRPNWGYEGGSTWGPDDQISFFLGYGQLFGLALVLILLLIGFIRLLLRKEKISLLEKLLSIFNFNNKERSILKYNLFFLGSVCFLFVGALYMTLVKSAWIWKLIPVFEFIQFPWRFMSVAIVFLSLAIGFIATKINKSFHQLTLFLVLLVAILLSNFYYFRPEKYLDDANDFYYTDEKIIQSNMSEILPDYIPSEMAKKLKPPQSLIMNEDLSEENYEILVDKTHEKLVKVNFSEETELDFALADYPGWQAEIDGEDVEHGLGEIGNIKITVPAGDSLVGARFGYTNVRLISDLISAGAWVLLLGLLVEVKRK